EFLRVPAEERMKCPQCGKGLKVPASMAGRKMKCARCQASLSAATLTQPPPVPERVETMPPSLVETAARRPPEPAPTSPVEPAAGRGPRLLVVLIVALTVLLVAGLVHWWPSREDGSPPPRSTGKDKGKEETASLQLQELKPITLRAGEKTT